MRFNSIAPTMAKAAIAINSADEVGERDIPVSLFFESVADAGMSEKEAAYTMALDPATLSRVKSGQARLTFEAIWRMPDAFWSVFTSKVIAAKGLSEIRTREIKAARISELVRLLVEVA
jgi:hypothetical protein